MLLQVDVDRTEVIEMVVRNRDWRGYQQALRLLSFNLLAVLALSMFLTDVGFSNVVGSDTQNFNPVTDGVDNVTVHSSNTLEPGFFNLGLFSTYAKNTLPYFKKNDGTDDRIRFDDAIIATDAMIGYGIMKNWDVGVSLPAVLYQDAKSEGYHGQFEKRGLTDIRINTKYKLWGTKDYGIATILSTNMNLIEDNPYVGKSAAPIINLELAGDVKIANVGLAANVGYRWRHPGQKLEDDTPIEPLRDMVIASGAASVDITPSNKIIAEIYSSIPSTEVNDASDRLQSSAEANLGLKHQATKELALHIGGGSELIRGVSSPDFRVYAGLNYTFGPEKQPEPPAKPEAKPAKVESPKADPFAGPPKKEETIVVHDILFEFDSDKVVLPGSYSTLDRLAAYLKKEPVFKKLIIEGHTDAIGSGQYNQGLSARRAASIKAFLVKRHHLDPSKIETNGFGKSKPIATNHNAQGRQLNRRVEFKIYR